MPPDPFVDRTTPFPRADPPAEIAGLARWLLEQATEVDDPLGLVDGLGRALHAMGVPVLKIGIGAPTLSPSQRGLNLVWWRDRGVKVWATTHDEAGEAEYRRSPIRALLEEGGSRVRWRVETGDGCDRFPVLADLRAAGGTDYRLMLAGFAPGTAIVGVAINFASDRPGGFTDDHATVFEALMPALGLALYRLNVSRTMQRLLDAYVGPMTAARVLNGSVHRGQGEVISAAILLADLKSFTRLADHEDPLKVVGWLDQHLDALGEGIGPAGGEILKFTGDGFIAVFPVAERDVRPCGVCGRALEAVRAGLAANRALEARRRAAGEPWLAADLVLHYGEVVYGNIGTADRLDFTAIGRAVNEASRIETLCDALRCNVLLSDSFAERCGVPLVDLGEHALRGVEAPRRLWTISSDAAA